MTEIHERQPGDTPVGTGTRPKGGFLASRFHRIVARAVLVLVGILIGAGAGEILLRLFLPQTLGLRWYTRENVLVHVPNLRSTYIRPEYTTRMEIDSDGLRDREYPPGKPAGVYRVLLLGDSYAEGIQVPMEQTFPKIAEGILRRARPDLRIEIVNAGVAGYGTADELRYLEAFGKRWQPDLVLVAFYSGNDVRNNFTSRDLRRVNGSLRVSRKGLGEGQYRIKAVRNWLAAHSHLYQYLRARLPSGHGGDKKTREVIDGVRLATAREGAGGSGAGSPASRAGDPTGDPSPLGGAVDGGASGDATGHGPGRSDSSPEPSVPSGNPEPRQNWSDTPVEEFDDRDVMRENPDPDFVLGWDLTRELMGRIDETARGLGARTAILALPSRWQIDRELLASRVGAAAIDNGTYDAALPGRRVCGFAAGLGAPCLDVYPDFRSAGADASWYWQIDSHFTPKAHEAAARSIASFLLEKVLPQPSAAAR